MRVQLFVTCLVDVARPEIGERTVRLLERLGCEVEFPRRQTCCGQPAHNSGYPAEGRRVTRAWERAFSATDGPIVAPFGSCVHHVRRHAAPEVAGRVKDLGTFVVEDLGVRDAGGRFDGVVAWHDECHLRRGLGTAAASRALLDAVPGCRVVDLPRADLCCGFGGTFSLKAPRISAAMADEKLDRAVEAGVDALVSTDPGCLLHLEGRARRRGIPLRVHHLVDLLEPEGRL